MKPVKLHYVKLTSFYIYTLLNIPEPEPDILVFTSNVQLSKYKLDELTL